MSFIQDTAAVRSSFSGGKITTTGFYPITITKAYEHPAQSPSMSVSIQFDAITDSGQPVQFKVCHVGRDGVTKNEVGCGQINDLMVLLGIKTLSHKPAMVDIYDFDLRTDVKQKKLSYADLVGQHVGAIFQMVREGKRFKEDGEWKTSTVDFVNKPEFKGFASDTGQTAKEFLDGAAPTSIEKYVASLDPVKGVAPGDSHIIKQASNQPNAPVGDTVGFTQSAVDDFDDDIPFN